MSNVPPSAVARLRAASRDLVRELGFMNRTLAGTELPASAVHALIEVGHAGSLTPGALADVLRLDKTTVSRLVQSLARRGLIRETRVESDARLKRLRLTGEGERVSAAINAVADRRVAAALAGLDQRDRRTVLAGVEAYGTALRRTGSEAGAVAVVAADEPAPVIGEGYTPGLIGRIVAMHAVYYAATAGFGAAFEAKVASGLGAFVPRLAERANAIWHASVADEIVGAVAIDGEGLGEGQGHLRWFIVADGHRGRGIGQALLVAATAFCDRARFRCTQLWTFEGLDAARRLYERRGFELAETYPDRGYGVEVMAQRFVRPGPGGGHQ